MEKFGNSCGSQGKEVEFCCETVETCCAVRLDSLTDRLNEIAGVCIEDTHFHAGNNFGAAKLSLKK